MSQIRRLVDENIPPDLQQQIIGDVRGAYKKADERCKELEEPERQNGIGVFRKVAVDGALRATFNAYADPAIRGEAERNRGRTSFMTLLRAGRLVLTPATTQYPMSLPPPSRFREGLAIEGQLDLFREGRPLEEGFVVAILAHGAHSVRADAPDWVRLLFPDRTGQTLACDPVDLLTAAPLPRTEEGPEEQDDLHVPLRKDLDADQDAETKQEDQT